MSTAVRRRPGGRGAPADQEATTPQAAGDGLRPLLLLLAAYLAVVVVYPLARLVETALRDADGRWTGGFVRDGLTAPGLASATRNSLVVAVAVTLLATALGAVLAWLVGRTDVPGRRWLRPALLLPFLMPPFVGAMAWLKLLGGAGWLNQLAQLAPFVERGWNVRGADGIVFVLVVTSYPLAYVTVLAALTRLDPGLEESARSSGAGLARTVRDVTAPLLRPAVASGAVLVFVYSMANFGVPAVLGFTEGFYVLPTRIYDLIARSAQPGSLNQAAALSLLLGLIAVGCLILHRLGGRRTDEDLPQRAMGEATLRLGRGRPVAGVLAWAVVAVAGVLPLAAIVLGALTRTAGRLPVPGNLTLEHLATAVTASPSTLRALGNSLLLATGAAIIITVVGALVAYLSQRTGLRGRGLLDTVATLPFALPGTVIGAATLLAFIRPLGPIDVFNTLWIILLAYLAHYLAYGVRATAGAMAMMDPSLEEVSRACGASRLVTLRRVVLPVLRPALFAGFFLVFVPALRELTISILLWAPGTETIGVIVFNLQLAGQSQAAAAVAVLLLALVVAANLLTRRMSGGRLGY